MREKDASPSIVADCNRNSLDLCPLYSSHVIVRPTNAQSCSIHFYKFVHRSNCEKRVWLDQWRRALNSSQLALTVFNVHCQGQTSWQMSSTRSTFHKNPPNRNSSVQLKLRWHVLAGFLWKILYSSSIGDPTGDVDVLDWLLARQSKLTPPRCCQKKLFQNWTFKVVLPYWIVVYLFIYCFLKWWLFSAVYLFIFCWLSWLK